jgi:hypothetical protein
MPHHLMKMVRPDDLKYNSVFWEKLLGASEIVFHPFTILFLKFRIHYKNKLFFYIFMRKKRIQFLVYYLIFLFYVNFVSIT